MNPNNNNIRPRYSNPQYRNPQYRPPQTPPPDMYTDHTGYNPGYYRPMLPQQPHPQGGFSQWSAPSPDSGFNMTPGSFFASQTVVDSPPTEFNPFYSPEEVPDSQPIRPSEPSSSRPKPKRSHKKKAANEPKERATQQPWTAADQKDLCMSWMEVSEDPVRANYQHRDAYWDRVTAHYNGLVRRRDSNRPERSADSVSGKWRKMQADMIAFNEVYKRMVEHPPSGASMEDIQIRAQSEYQKLTKCVFTYLAEWNLVKDCPKFQMVAQPALFREDDCTPLQPRTKRSKTTESSSDQQSQRSDAGVAFDLNAEDDDPTPPRRGPNRPIGRNAAKRAMYGGSSSSGGSMMPDELRPFSDQLERLVVTVSTRGEQARQSMAEYMDIARERNDILRQQRDMDFLRIPTEGLEPEMVEQINKIKADICKKYYGGGH